MAIITYLKYTVLFTMCFQLNSEKKKNSVKWGERYGSEQTDWNVTGGSWISKSQ